MKREERLRTQADFDRVFSRGKSFANRLAVLYVLPTCSTERRVGFIVTRRLGNAVTRNRLRRRYREALRLLWDNVREGYDFVVLPRRAGKDVAFVEIRNALEKALRQANAYDEGS